MSKGTNIVWIVGLTISVLMVVGLIYGLATDDVYSEGTAEVYEEIILSNIEVIYSGETVDEHRAYVSLFYCKITKQYYMVASAHEATSIIKVEIEE